MHFRIHVHEPAGELNHHSTAYSVMQKSVVAYAKKRLSSSRVEERKGPADHKATSPTRIALTLPITVRQFITFIDMLARAIERTFLLICVSFNAVTKFFQLRSMVLPIESLEITFCFS